MNDNDTKNAKKGTISIRKKIDIKSTNTSNNNRVVEVEIKAKRSSGLRFNLNTTTEKRHGPTVEEAAKATGLTEQEFKRRMDIFKETVHDEKHNIETVAQPINNVVKQNIEQEQNVDTQNLENLQQKQPEKTTNHKKNEKKFPKTQEQIKTVRPAPLVFKASEYTKPKQSKHDFQKAKNSEKQQQNQQQNKKTKISEDYQEKKRARIEIAANKTNTRRVGNTKKMSRAVLDRVMDDGSEERTRSIASFKRAKQKLRTGGIKKEVQKVIREVEIPDSIVVSELANRMAVRSAEVVKLLMKLGTMVTINQSIDGDTAEVICTEFGHKVKRVSDSDVEIGLDGYIDNEAELVERPPIVAVMGHVDHGKTTLLDTLRNTSVVARESGGITQHVAAYQMKIGDKKITFIDTPGHAAFSKIRARGAVITDIVILVVSADDGVKAQTIEAISDAKSQNVPIIVAINKIDKANANVDRVKTELMNYDVILEEYSGDVLSTEISALKNQNIDKLLDAVFLQAEMMQLRANPNSPAVGIILETKIVKGRGMVSTAIIQKGTLSIGDVFVAGASFGKVRSLYNDAGEQVKQAFPSDPINIVGFDSAPEPGDTLLVVESEQKAREIAEYRKRRLKEKAFTESNTQKSKLIGTVNSKQFLKLFIKGDVAGSIEALALTLTSIEHDEVGVVVTGTSIGDVNESDVEFAHQTGSIVVGFNVNISPAAKNYAKLHNVEIFIDDVIYRIVDDVKRRMGKMLPPIIEENYIGTCEVRKVFFISRLGTIAGCYVTDGIIKRINTKISVLRNNEEIFNGKITSMKHEKDEIKESKQSHECGILTEGFNDYKEGDIIKCYEITQKERFVS